MGTVRSVTTSNLRTDLAALTAAADDFGHVVHRVPAAVARPRNVLDVCDLVRYANSAGLALRARGGGNSVSGQAQCDGGIVCDLAAMDDAWQVQDKRFKIPRVQAGPGARWSAVLAAAMEHGLTPPVLPDYLELTVGGTLSTGGIGGTSHLYGPQVDNVLGLKVVMGDARCYCYWPSPGFPEALAGQGNAGIIIEATIPLVPAPSQVRVYQVIAPDLAMLIGWQRHLARDRRFGYLGGQILTDGSGRWQYRLEAAWYRTDSSRPPDAALLEGLDLGPRVVETEDIDYLAFCHRMQPAVRQLAITGDWYRPHPWLSVLLPGNAVERYVAKALDWMMPELIGSIPMLLGPLRRGAVPAPGLTTPDGDADGLFWSFDIARTVADEAEMIAAALAENAALTNTAIAAGGTSYPNAAAAEVPRSPRPGRPRR